MDGLNRIFSEVQWESGLRWRWVRKDSRVDCVVWLCDGGVIDVGMSASIEVDVRVTVVQVRVEIGGRIWLASGYGWN